MPKIFGSGFLLLAATLAFFPTSAMATWTMQQCMSRGSGVDKSKCSDWEGHLSCGCACTIDFDVNGTPQDSPVRIAQQNCSDSCYKQYCESPLTQTTSQKASADLNKEASAQSASMGVVAIAEGANVIIEDENSGGILIEGGLESIKAAEGLKQMEKQAKENAGDYIGSLDLSTDPTILNSARANEIFEDLERLYGLLIPA